MIEADDSTSLQNLPELILPYERDTFLWLNSPHSDYWDIFMRIYSGKALWIPLTLVLLFLTFYKTKWQNAVLFILCFALLATLCDQLSASVVKPFFSRLRPTHHPDFMNYVLTVNDYRGGRFGFVSSHAANGFGVVTFLALVYKNKWLTATLLTWVLVTCYSRIYLGVHFISDIVGGMIIGSLLGFLIYLLFGYLRNLLFGYLRIRLLKDRIEDFEAPVYGKRHAYILISAIWATVLFNFIFSFIIFYQGK